jgi:hypothetical protein
LEYVSALFAGLLSVFGLSWYRGKQNERKQKKMTHDHEKIMVKYLGSLAHPMATSLMSSVKNGDSVILEITPSYYSTWDYSEKRRQ